MDQAKSLKFYLDNSLKKTVSVNFAEQLVLFESTTGVERQWRELTFRPPPQNAGLLGEGEGRLAISAFVPSP